MEFAETIKSLFSLLTSFDEPYLGVSPPVNIEDSTPVEVEGELEDCEPLDKFAYLDSSSRMISVRGANIYFASLYANLVEEQIMIPLQTDLPFMAIKASEEVRNIIDNTIHDIVLTKNVNDVPYDENYKDDNILDELRILLENYAIEKSSYVAIVDGPVVPGPYLQMVGEPYRSAFITLARQRKKEKLIGVVKRLNYTRKLRRSGLAIPKNLYNATDDVIVEFLGRGKDVFLTPVLKEESEDFTRYMVYVKVRNGVFRVESTERGLLCKGVSTSIKYSSFRGIPEFIEVADRISKKLSASAFIFAFNIAKETTGVNYDDWESLKLANVDTGE
ncbi:DNA double-strand break repair nuclease NurA [Acidianus sp. HS-5]|uniref:DNA double-strand break repair nuclease NurA n=1 Tax=Acidianus sp. HS-5 TaxID=2886040 RepID=UPI001F3E2995|nr:DNA double-strand break repair nuclease NurA [Acidianus sp. HS-5]BDC17531.1 hypothetical protein HS5_04210 [Acidianus sp. HS-5]